MSNDHNQDWRQGVRSHALDNATAAAFKKLLPLSVTMTELNGNEKFARLPGTLPARGQRPHPSRPET